MPKLSRKVWILGGIALALLLVVVVVLPSLLDVERYRAALEQHLEESLGRGVRLGGMGVSLRPFGVKVSDFAIGPLPDEGDQDMLSVDGVTIGARLGPLLKGKLEVTSFVIDQPTVNAVRAPDGRWNFERLGTQERVETKEPEAAPSDSEPLQFSMDELRLSNATLSVTDLTAPEPQTLTLTAFNLRFDDFALDRETAIELSTNFRELPGASLALAGRVGPIQRAPGESMALSGDLTLTEVNLSELAALLGASVSQESAAPFSASVKLDASITGALIDLRTLELDVDGRKAAARGSIRREAELRRLDFEILPTTLAAADLTALARVAGQDASFAAPSPIQLEGRLTGTLGEGHKPRFDGKARVRALEVRHPAIAAPLRDLNADLSVAGERVELTGFSMALGKSDLAGTLSLENLDAPRVDFTLSSKNLDFSELVSLMAGEEQEGAPKQPQEAQQDAEGSRLEKLTASGKIQVARGVFDKLAFSNLDADLEIRDGEARLEPVRMDLYDGTFSGRVRKRLVGEPSSFQLDGEASAVDVAGLLEATLGRRGLVSGKLSGRLDAKGAGNDLDSVLGSLAGSGSLLVSEGEAGQFNVLGAFSKVAGILGDKGLATAGNVLETVGTPFTKLEGKALIKDGKARLKTVLLESPSLDLQGEAVVDMLGSTIDGNFTVVFSEALSSSMQVDGTRAGQVFWNARLERVQLPFGIDGALGSPKVHIDWGGAASGQVEERLGVSTKGGASGIASSLLSGAAGSEAAMEAASASAHGLQVSITKARWKGFLVKNLELEGEVGGKFDHVSLEVKDASGKSIQRIGRVKDLKQGRWKAKFDGKNLALASAPFSIEVKAVDASGRSATASQKVNR